jgi:4-alpha-glucanotransferase
MLPGWITEEYRRRVEEALRALEVQNLLLGIQDPSLPGRAGEDTGRGAPSSAGAAEFFELMRALGFNGVQFGPQGQTSESNPSPYDGTIFSRNVLSIDLAALAHDPAWAGLLSAETFAAVVAAAPEGAGARMPYAYVYRSHHAALREAFETFRARRDHATPGDPVWTLAQGMEAFAHANHSWLERDALYGPLCLEHGEGHFRDWRGPGAEIDQRLWSPRPGEERACEARREELRTRYRDEIERYVFEQFVAHEQHRTLRARAASLGLELFGDLQIGLSPQDVWSYQSLFLSDYLMGAPPSRTNPDGQPWNYAVLDPAQYLTPAGEPGPARRFLSARVDKLLAEFDGLRIDHPHGMVCPWVYRAWQDDPLRAVQTGARLFSSPDLPDHPALARFAIATPAQLDRTLPRHADGWVRTLTEAQVARYSVLFDEVVEAALRHGRRTSDLVCEVLSTLPYPLRRVIEHHGLGRFRVTQKASPTDPHDVYRSENAAPQDWIMVGNHDTKPIWLLAAQWQGTDSLRARAAYLAERLCPDPAARAAFAQKLEHDPSALVHAMFADVFASRARNVLVFFTDLFGMTASFNAPGVVDAANWSLRVGNDYAQDYRTRLMQGAALNLPAALALALRARGGAPEGLIPALERLAATLHGGGGSGKA